VTREAEGEGAIRVREPGPPRVHAHGYWEFVLRRLLRDRAAVASIVAVIVILFAAFAGGPILAAIVGHGPNDIFPYAVDENRNPVGPLTRVPDVNTHVHGGPPEKTTLFVLGGDGTLGRDELLRVLYGGRVSIEVALGATIIALMIGVLLGSIAALAGGIVDSAIARLTELAMAFPVLLFLMLLGSSSFADRMDTITFGGLLDQGVVSIAILIGLFTWFYPARLVRAEMKSLKTREFVEAARMTGAGSWRITRVELLPHLVPMLMVYGSLIMATNIILEASITFLGVGIRLPTASWGSLLSSTWGTLLDPYNAFYLVPEKQALLTVWPSFAIFATVLSFNLLGDGIRQAFEPERRS
jgi:peptide/nickel transport system permease protein/oligopeptide transport system permease protein